MKEKEVLVKVEGLSKKFCKDLKTSLWYGVKDLVSGIRGNSLERTLRPKEFWAIQDINFELRRGECLGLIGHNGAGKSTLLKILNGLINPDAGSVTIKGRVGALIELGAGFNPILSGRENIYNNGAVLGFTRKEIDEKLNAIIEFAELEEFIDMPVQHYSSGMNVRLGFAVAAQMEPDVLIVDEVLAVGDLGFILKCFKAIDTILPKTAVIFVSHNMPMISRICNQVILLSKGKAEFQGENVSKGIDLYYNSFLTNEDSDVVFTDNSLELVNASLENVKKENGIYKINWGDTIDLKFTIKNFSLKKMPFISFAIYDKEQRGIAEVFPENQILKDIEPNSEIDFHFVFRNLNLSKGIYNITFSASEAYSKNSYYKIHKAITIQVEHDKQIWTSFLIDSELKQVI
ncbi:ABC transporter ATP-binding protein [Flavobacteriaceae bacterium S0825]|uniref:ABC transporter ATP-binding protein n=1 Tax=Gaetbulibacter sp. S0825 TaxID=2720084 RepID=UPI0014301CA0|nr:ABC transporter ATP-binding protein [Gaetbulibacter sp. S0825]MCK0109014.1 ABC transporter ATP-binding protein [Flavobacteriaceae bacterium S0825]NIX64649.1 ATP-binding cassette domain-containing protein [Gaetbulibacter sp. S0825]